jgi:ATP-dependent RNA helicase RhlE
MLDLGFIEDIRKILTLLPKKRQNLLFSATFSSEIRALAGSLLHRPEQIEAGQRNSAADSVKQWLYEVDKSRKADLLCHLLRNNDWQQILVFIRTRNGADRLVDKLTVAGISALAIHGDKSQGARSRALADFKAKTMRVLVATDIASRGLDISELSHVINFDLPKVAEDYIHRIGRTGRAGLEGVAISLVSADEVNLLSAIETLIRRLLVREVETGYIPTHSVPITRLMNPRRKKPKKPKKQVPDQPLPEAAGLAPSIDRESPHRKPRWSGTIQDEGNSQGAGGGRRRQKSSSNTTSTSSKRGASRKNTTRRK